MNKVESTAQRMLPGRTSAALEPLRLLAPRTPIMTAATIPGSSAFQAIYQVNVEGIVLAIAGAANRVTSAALKNIPGLGDLGADGLTSARRHALLG